LISKCCNANPQNRPDIRQITRKLQSITEELEPSNAQLTEAMVNADGNDDPVES